MKTLQASWQRAYIASSMPSRSFVTFRQRRRKWKLSCIRSCQPRTFQPACLHRRRRRARRLNRPRAGLFVHHVHPWFHHPKSHGSYRLRSKRRRHHNRLHRPVVSVGHSVHLRQRLPAPLRSASALPFKRLKSSLQRLSASAANSPPPALRLARRRSPHLSRHRQTRAHLHTCRPPRCTLVSRSCGELWMST